VKRIVAISDLQCPYEDKRAVEAVAQFIEDYKPDSVISVGDECDLSPISRWVEGKQHAWTGNLDKERNRTVEVLGMLKVQHITRSNHLDRWYKTLIVDVDDHYDGLHDDNLAKHTTDPDVNKIKNRDYHREVIETADVVTVTTPFLYEYYKPIAKRVVMVRNGINPNQFLKNDQLNRKVVIGWVGSMGWRSGDIETTKEWLPDFLAEHDLMFYHGGHMDSVKSFSEASGVPDERIVTLPATSLATYHALFEPMDIGLVPLTDIDFNVAKSTIKGLEYAASNIPFVASALPEYRLLENQGVGRVAVTPDDWVYHLTQLLDWKTRKKEAAVQRTRVLKHHTIVQRAHEWKELFEEPHDPIKIKTMTVPYNHL